MKNIHPEHVLGSLLCKPQYAMNHLQKVTAHSKGREGGTAKIQQRINRTRKQRYK